MGFSLLRYVPSVPNSITFYHEGTLSIAKDMCFLKSFLWGNFYLYWYDHVISILTSVCVLYYIYLFEYWNIHQWRKVILCMVYKLWEITTSRLHLYFSLFMLNAAFSHLYSLPHIFFYSTWLCLWWCFSLLFAWLFYLFLKILFLFMWKFMSLRRFVCLSAVSTEGVLWHWKYMQFWDAHCKF